MVFNFIDIKVPMEKVENSVPEKYIILIMLNMYII